MSHEQIPRSEKERILDIPGVYGVGESHDDNGDTIAVVSIDEDSSATEDDIPATIAGYPAYVEFGERPSLSAVEPVETVNAENTVRPLEGGVSTRNATMAGGTGSTDFVFEDGGEYFIGSNWHVWHAGDGQAGDVIQQPSSVDGDAGPIGELDGWADPFDADIDFAWIAPYGDVGLTTEVYGLGEVTGSTEPSVGMNVTKSGRTTGITSGEVEQSNMLIEEAEYGYRLGNQYRGSYESDGGDSGSPILNDDNEAVGIHWGSSGTFFSVKAAEDFMGATVATGDIDGGGGGGDPPDGPDDPNIDPRAQFGGSTDGLTVTIDASGSTDPDGEIVDYEWDMGDGNVRHGVQGSYTYSSGGEYEITLTVTDNDGASASKSRLIPVSEPDPVEPPNEPPEPDWFADKDGLTVHFDGTGSSDPDGTIDTYEWEFGDGSTATGATPTHTYDSAGTYRVKVHVTDNDGETRTFSDTISVNRPGQPPVAEFTYTMNGRTVEVDAGESRDPDGSIVSYEWQFGPLFASATGQTASYTYQSGQKHDVTLTVTDDDGRSDTSVATVDPVNDPDPPDEPTDPPDEPNDPPDEPTDPPTECTYQGSPRSEWGYEGEEQGDFEDWQACDITTDEFAFRTRDGNGTNALVPPEETDEPLNPMLVLMGVGVGAFALLQSK